MVPKMLVSLLLIVFISCQSSDCSNCNIYNIQAIDTFNHGNIQFTRDIPLDNQGKPDPIYESIQEMYGKLGLPKIDSPRQDLAIRIEADLDTTNHGSEVVYITLINGEWQGMYHQFANAPNDSAKIISDSMPIVPKIGWCKFMCNLISKDILDLPQMSITKGNELVIADGRYVFFEIASKSKYRFYYYYSPETLASKRFKEGDMVIEIMKCIHENLDFRNIRKSQ